MKIAAYFFLIALTLIIIVSAQGFAVDETHLDRSVLPQGCSSCHKSHGKRATVLLERPKDELCFKCHGSFKSGVTGEARTDIYSVILKRSNHPVIQTTRYHAPGETLPEKTTSAPRHASCYDCHNSHLSSKDNPIAGARGYSGRGMEIKRARYEYEVCYKCHSDSANLPVDSENIAREFDPGNASYHPVETSGRNRDVPSLLEKLSTLSTITCSDCHGNDDKGGPKGPHGSNYEFLLKENYSREPGPESPNAYELCYGCHRRNSILNDESFDAHKQHVLYGNVSCYSCHDPHGSSNFENLINFDPTLVSENSQGQIDYQSLSRGRPRCLLTCHVEGATYEHKVTDGQFCVNTNCVPGW